MLRKFVSRNLRCGSHKGCKDYSNRLRIDILKINKDRSYFGYSIKKMLIWFTIGIKLGSVYPVPRISLCWCLQIRGSCEKNSKDTQRIDKEGSALIKYDALTLARWPVIARNLFACRSSPRFLFRVWYAAADRRWPASCSLQFFLAVRSFCRYGHDKILWGAMSGNAPNEWPIGAHALWWEPDRTVSFESTIYRLE